MKTRLTSFLLFISVLSKAQISYIGHDHPICSSPSTINYSFDNNLTSGSHGHGYTIYRNGNAIYQKVANYNVYILLKMVFINDSTGFYVEHYLYYDIIYKTSDYGMSWTSMGATPDRFIDFYVLNENEIYVLIDEHDIMQYALYKIPDSSFSPVPLIFDTLFNSSIYIHDTLQYPTLCTIDTLKFFTRNGVDTISYNIILYAPLISVNEIESVNETILITPNPSNEYFSLANVSFECIKSINLYSLTGKLVKSFSSTDIEENYFSVREIANGTYLLGINSSSEFSLKKILINK